jgi:hypothetical protein
MLAVGYACCDTLQPAAVIYYPHNIFILKDEESRDFGNLEAVMLTLNFATLLDGTMWCKVVCVVFMKASGGVEM